MDNTRTQSTKHFGTRVYIYRHWEVKNHYETDASQALGKLCLIGLTETHQRVSALPHKHTHRFASHLTVILHISDLRFSYSVPNMASRQCLREGSQKVKWKRMKCKEHTTVNVFLHIFSISFFSKIANVPLGHSSAIKLTSNYCFYYKLVCQSSYNYFLD